MPDLTAISRIASVFAPEQVTCLAVTPDQKHLLVGAGSRLLVYVIPADMAADGGAGFTRAAAIDLPGDISAITVAPDGSALFAAIGDRIHVLQIPL
jgi:hypothetical protein